MFALIKKVYGGYNVGYVLLYGSVRNNLSLMILRNVVKALLFTPTDAIENNCSPSYFFLVF